MLRWYQLVLLGKCLEGVAESSSLLDDNYPTEKHHVTITSWDGTLLSADVHIPKPKSANEVFPVVIFANSWACPEFEYIVESIKLAASGYLVVEYETRGWSPSGGMIEAAGHQDQLDTSSVINYTFAQADWHPNVDKLALAGISYGAGLALMGAAHDSRVTTAVAMSGWANLLKALYHNKSPNLVWGNVLVMSGKLIGKLDPDIIAVWKQVLIGNESAFTEWALNRSVVKYKSAFQERQVPLFLSSNLEDRLFEGEDVMDFFEQHPGPKKLLLNQGIHATAEIGGLLDLPGNYIWKEVKLWLDRWLKGAQPPPEDPLVDVQLRSNKKIRERFVEWPSKRIAPLTYSLSARARHGHGSLIQPASPPDVEASDTISFSKNSGFNAGLPIVGEVLQVFIDTRITTPLLLTNQKHAIWYYTSLARRTRICGIPEVTLDFTPSSSSWQVVVYLWSVDFLKVGTLVSHGAVSCWNCTAGQRVQRNIQLRALVEDVEGGLALGFDMFSELYQPPNQDRDSTLTFHYSDSFTLTIPEVLSGEESASENIVLMV
mmetsp:Transcript_86109/g.180104  ORF Transcript_86109/g.180104 Transcript_86109/m.180104 type:complete len:545 (+) Transcript_86109:186-1820(+)|eukprot:CAMPEP_0206434368 /NCGR_PEP_ID=MMETSP0324_2-20121206/9117_1 /ASSEMBLY_ACC=CAM_ASM_000836 /TAXON_ID=2866 /ORGANISM="Crypthecodinium cohnii, Strain Seligo" /LENGTH=544 /DNA_ID=CAMNT_0053900871 /DNA_START=155 /DNA_END=1789 /DNA_ORIENTATION=-